MALISSLQLGCASLSVGQGSSFVCGIPNSNLPRQRLPHWAPVVSIRQRSRGHISCSADSSSREPWDVGRFARTFLFFNKPPSLQGLLSRLLPIPQDSSPSPSPPLDSGEGVVLVIGATGGVGKRVVDALVDRGVRVRALVRDADKGRALLGPAVEIVTADVAQLQTLQPQYLEGVRRVVNCAAVVVRPKEGDTPDRQKYYQGIKFYDPEIAGDTPEAVEFNGVANILKALRDQLGLREGVTLFQLNAQGIPSGPAWGPLDDVVMGGVSESNLHFEKEGGENGLPTAVFKGTVSTSNNGGFVSVRTKNFSPPLNLSAYEGLKLRVRGDGQRFKLILRTSPEWDAIGYTTSFPTDKGQWQDIILPFSSFVPVFRAKSVPTAPPLNTAAITSLQLMLSKFEYDGALNPSFQPGPFELPVSSISAVLPQPVTPRFVHVGSAGVTRPKRPGLDLSKQPPAVRLNDELGGILTFKLKGEDLIRSSGLPFCIIRPCALTEEPAGADLIFEQGDNITGKIGREEVARICVAALFSPLAVDKTFEVKSTVPFSEVFKIDEANPPPARDYESFFVDLKEGITGKEQLVEELTSV